MTDRSIYNLARSLSGPLPGADEPAAAGPGRADAAILLVDDKADLLDSLARLVAEHGYQPDIAHGGRRALEMLTERRYDVMLLDLVMPEVSGQEVLERAAADGLCGKIIVVSGDPSFSGVKQALRCGAFDFVKKPYEGVELIATLESALQRCRQEAAAAAAERRLELRVAAPVHGQKLPGPGLSARP